MKKTISLIISLLIAFSIFAMPTVGYAYDECEHDYDSSCDTTCNLCGEEREAEPHIFEGWYDYETNSETNTITRRNECLFCDAYDTRTVVSLSSTITNVGGFTTDTIPNFSYGDQTIDFGSLSDKVIYEGTLITNEISYASSASETPLITCFVGILGLSVLWLGATFIIKARKASANGDAEDDDFYEPQSFIEN